MFIINLLKENYFSETQSSNNCSNSEINDINQCNKIDELNEIINEKKCNDLSNNKINFVDGELNDFCEKNTRIKPIPSVESFSDISHNDNDSFNLRYTKIFNEVEIQTDEDKNFNLLRQENQVLKIKNANLERNVKELTALINDYMKINSSNIDVENLKNKITILLNRELRMNYPMPFSNILSKCSK